MKSSRKVRRRRVIPIVFFLLALGLTVDYFAFPYGYWESGRRINRGENGLWLRYTWYFGQHSAIETQALAQRFVQEDIRYAYFHVRSIQKDGTLKYRDDAKARVLTANVHRQAPGVKVIAWVYVGNTRGRGQVDLSKPEVRRAMVNEARRLTTVCGFDGVQWDYEICDNGDPGLIDLLRETRAAFGPGKTLSVAAALWVPRPLRHWAWGEDYIKEVAANCDQITVMDYDTACWLPRTYVWLTHQQVVHFTQAVAQSNPNCRVLIGIPTYRDRTWSHLPHAENIRTALLGVREGLADSRTRLDVFAGVAVFADYTTQTTDWNLYDRMWNSPPGRTR